MADLTLIYKPSDSNFSKHVIFIHGLSGNSFSTWSSLEGEKTFWPIWLEEDIPDLAIWTIGYNASVSRLHGTAMHLTDRATNVLEQLLNEPDLNDGKEIILIGHSMGGLIIKQLLRTADSMSANRNEANTFIQSVHRVAFLATPHTGSNLASLADRLRIIIWPSEATMSLVKNDPNLRDLNYWYREWSQKNKIHHLTLMENQPLTHFGIIVVPVDSADPGLYDARPIMIDANHLTICKPANKNSEIYKNIKSFISRDLVTLNSDSLILKKLDEQTEKIDLLVDKPFSFPPELADREINKELNIIKKSRFFQEFSTVEHTLRLAEKLLNTDFSLGSNTTKSFALAWCARLLALTQYRENSIELLEKAKYYGNCQEIDIAEAFIIKGNKGFNEGLNRLSTLESPEAYTASLMMVNTENNIDTLTWFEKSGLTFKDLDSEGKLVLLGTLLANAHWDDTLKYINLLDEDSFINTPLLFHQAAIANLVQAVPDEFKPLIIERIPFELKTFPLASDESALKYRRKAQKYFEESGRVGQELNLTNYANMAFDYALWLELHDPERHESGLKKLKDSMRQSDQRLRRLHFAIDFGLVLDHEAIEKEIERQTVKSGGKSIDAALARFSLIFYQKSPKEILTYIERHRSQLESNLNPDVVWIIEIEAHTKNGSPKNAEEKLNQLVDKGLPEVEEKRLRSLIKEYSSSNPVEICQLQYEDSKSIRDLNNLVLTLEQEKDWIQLTKYGSILFEQTKTLSDAERLAKAYHETNQYSKLEDLLKNHLEFLDQSDLLLMFWSWVLYRNGLLSEAQKNLSKLKVKRDHPSDRSLEVSLAITSGNWESLLSFLEKEWSCRDQRDAYELLNSANLALSLNGPRVKDFLREAIKKADNDPNIFSNAYFTATRAGFEDEKEVGEWLQTSVQLSKEDGPIQQMSVEEFSTQIPKWNSHEAETWKQVYKAEIALFVAAHLMHKTLLEFTVLPALSNLSQSDVRKRPLIPAYSGNRAIVALPSTYKTVGMDTTSILTLSQLNLLNQVSDNFNEIHIPHSTLTWLFHEKQKIIFHQPSRVKAAKLLSELIATKKLNIFQMVTPPEQNLLLEVDEELASFITEAQIPDDRQKIVVVTSPVHRVQSFMKEEADLSEFYPYLSSSLSLVMFLREKGFLTSGEIEKATSYLSLHDKSWSAEALISNNAILYLDDVCVTYFQHLNIFEKLVQAGFEIYVSEQVKNENEALLRYNHLNSSVIEQIESTRNFLAQGINTGKIKLGQTSETSETSENELNALKHHPTFELIEVAKEENVNCVIIDERSLNKHSNLDANTRVVPIFTTYDLLNTLLSNEKISIHQMYEYTTKLRQYGYLFVPLTHEELKFHLSTAKITGGKVTETAELKAIRENILQIRMSSFLQIPQEVYWLNNVLNVIRDILQEEWKTVVNYNESAAKSNWLLEQLDLRGWSHFYNEEAGTNIAKFSFTSQYFALLINTNGLGENEQKLYFKWLEENVLNMLKEKEPLAYNYILTQVKGLINEQIKLLREK